MSPVAPAGAAACSRADDSAISCSMAEVSSSIQKRAFGMPSTFRWLAWSAAGAGSRSTEQAASRKSSVDATRRAEDRQIMTSIPKPDETITRFAVRAPP